MSATQTPFYNGAPQENWTVPMLCALGVHAAALIIAFLGPLFLDSRPRLPEVYTVNLFSVTDMPAAPPAGTPAAAPAASPPAPKKAEPETPKVKTPEQPPKPEPKAAPVEPKPAPAKPVIEKPPVKKEAISLKPPAKTKKDLEKLKRIKENLHAAQDVEVKEKEAEAAIKDAISNIKESLESSSPPSSVPPARTPGPPGNAAATPGVPGGAIGGSAGQGKLLEGYMALLLLHLQNHWTLPDNQRWDKGLRATIALQVTKEGVVLRKTFEKHSANVIFDKFVEKAIEDASPLPPFPPEMGGDEEELILTFWPGGLLEN